MSQTVQQLYVYHLPSVTTIRLQAPSLERPPPTDPRVRRLRPTFAVDEAIAWIKDRPAGRPWMATVSFASAHTPLMQPPADPALRGSIASRDLNCADQTAQRVLSNLMIDRPTSRSAGCSSRPAWHGEGPMTA
jgi:hypothetical protein